mmetsp:Transcript_28693/g.71957  ORF Transcript_28693/g.71957 Transcript_28693/m.71957 type:complete len:595 (+) Transcript_28693:267-2051(+)|eukprot:jgi/Tetstr1/439471/TSEL_027904.t1
MEEATEYGNIALLEHININTDLPLECLSFFCDALGFVQDPRQGEVIDGRVYVNTLLWLNAATSQLHIAVTTRGASGAPQNHLDGAVGLGFEDLDALASRLEAVAPSLAHTAFSWSRTDGKTLEACDPMGNRFVCQAAPRSSRDTRGFHPGPVSTCLGILWVEFNVPPEAAPSIAEYYRAYFHAAVAAQEPGLARVRAGPHQELRFREAPGRTPRGSERDKGEAYENSARGLHIALYLHDHATPMARLAADGLLWGNPRYTDLDTFLNLKQFRCKDIMRCGPSARKAVLLFELEHECRRMDHDATPFGHRQPYALLRREPVPALVSTVTDAYERDFQALRTAKMAAAREGFVPKPPGVAYKPLAVHTWDTPNGRKVALALEELRLPYVLRPVRPGGPEASSAAYLAIAPNGKVPAIEDPNVLQHDGTPLSVFESGAILLYLAERYGRGALLPGDPVGREKCLEWLFFQVGSFGPAAGQAHHFMSAEGRAPGLDGEASPAEPAGAAYGLQRFSQKVQELYTLMDAWLAQHEYFAGTEYTIADISIFCWVFQAWTYDVDLIKFPNVKRWYDAICVRPAVERGLMATEDMVKAVSAPA